MTPKNIAPLYSPRLSQFPDLIHGFYQKETAPDSTIPLCLLKQIHSQKVITVSELLTSLHEGDGLVTRASELMLGVQTADCVPILLYDPINRVVGAIHAGWRGALGGIVHAGVTAMIDQGARAHHIVAALGPSIAQKSFEIGPEVYETFLDQHPMNQEFFAPSERPNHFYFDLKGYAATQLERIGLSQIDILPIDTRTDSRFFSYRQTLAEGKIAQKRNNLSIIALAPC